MTYLKPVDWSSTFVIDERNLSLDDWLKEIYHRYSDRQISEFLAKNGIDANAQKVGRHRRALGLYKYAGCTPMVDPPSGILL